MTADDQDETDDQDKTVIKVRESGPLQIRGSFTLVDQSGTPIPVDRDDRNSIVLCRCGRSSDQPFCDGSHKNHS